VPTIKRSIAVVLLVAGCAPAAIGSPATAGATGLAATATPGPTTTESTGSFARTGSMTTLRSGHTATLLANDRVLITAGVDMQDGTTTELTSAELYDPGSGTFSPTGSLTTSRSVHTATLLVDGRVLIVGGTNFRNGSFTSISSGELYDPRTGTFSPTGSLTTSRSGHTATLLADGRVLIAGGATLKNGTTTVLASAELFDPRTGTFGPTGSMSTPRILDTATLLADGRVLVVGGINPTSGVSSSIGTAELYDPRTGKFSPTGSLPTPRLGHTATLLTDGRVLVAGGDNISNGVPISLASAELFDPRTGTFGPTGSMATVRFVQSAARLVDGQVLVVGGSDDLSGGPNALASAELFDSRAGTFRPTASMTAARVNFTATVLVDGNILITGGDSLDQGVQTSYATAELFERH
jgi:hypothetical protein